MRTPLRDHAFGALLHPITLTAIGLQLVNDHVLRRVIPSPVWGKLGDVTMLIYAPLLFAALLALVTPGRGDRARRSVGIAGIGIVGVWFTFGKTVPAVLATTNALASWITGRPSHLILDPTDLITLPALAIAWWVWQRPAPIQTRPGLRPLGLASLTLAWLATVATSVPITPIGITRVCLTDGVLRAEADFEGGTGPLDVYRSTDGGFTWVEIDGLPEQLCSGPSRETSPLTLAVPGRSERYRITYEHGVERSADEGATWIPIYNSRVDAIAGVYAGEILVGPLDAVVEPSTGNLVVGMGRRGVIVVAPEQELTWVSVAHYSRSYDHEKHLLYVLSYPLITSVFVVLLSIYWIGRASVGLSIGLRRLNWLLLIVFALNILFLHTNSNWPESPPSEGPRLVLDPQQFILALMAIPAAVAAGQAMHGARAQRPRLLPLAIAFALLAGIVFFVPFGLWGYSGYPGFAAGSILLGGLSLAPALALIMMGLVVLGALVTLRQPQQPISTPHMHPNERDDQ